MRPALLTATLLLVSGSPAQQLPVSSHKLSNGMRILIHEDHDIPNVALYLFFQVGSRNERSGATGMSHFFEHMMFNGARKYGPKQFDIQMENAGGSNNAYTSFDVTVYTDWFPASALELMFDMEADRIQNLAFDPKMIESERGVVYSERRLRVDNSNSGAVVEQLYAAAFQTHPYHWPVIGWAADIENWKIGDLKEHFRMGYAPNNCVAVVAGAIREADVMRLARKYLEPISPHDPPPPVHAREPQQLGERRVEIRKPAQAPMLAAGYHVPETRHPDTPALEMLARILSAGRSSRLYRRLVDHDQSVLEVSVDLQETLDPGLMMLFAQLRPGAKPEAVEQAVEEEIDRLRREPPSTAELEKGRNQALTAFYRSLRTISGKANALGRAEIFRGGHLKLGSYAADMRRVTAQDVSTAAARYLLRRNRTVVTLIPEASGPEALP